VIDRINLLPEELKRAEKKKQIRKGLALFVALNMLCLVLLHFHQKSIVMDKEKIVSSFKEERRALLSKQKSYRTIGDNLKLIEKKNREIERRMELVTSIVSSKIYWSEILRRVTLLIPESLWLTSISSYNLGDESTEKPGIKGIKFNGTASSNGQIAQFIFSLENSSIFENIFLTFTAKRTHLEQELFDFELNADIGSNGYRL
jgi:Tfp pilus assembly protein PilN